MGFFWNFFFFFDKKFVIFLKFFRSVNLTNSANFWGKSPTFKYQKIEGKKNKINTPTLAHPCLPNYDYVLFEWAHYVM
jgi:hypothetical protein